jgi:predicted DNA-binding protein YlxM (UPF0122 family)
MIATVDQAQSSTPPTATIEAAHQGHYTITDLAELFSISRPTVYRTINRNNAKDMVP